MQVVVLRVAAYCDPSRWKRSKSTIVCHEISSTRNFSASIYKLYFSYVAKWPPLDSRIIHKSPCKSKFRRHNLAVELTGEVPQLSMNFIAPAISRCLNRVLTSDAVVNHKGRMYFKHPPRVTYIPSYAPVNVIDNARRLFLT